MSPRTEALAYRIWAYAEPRGWDVSINDIADALDVTVRRCGKVCATKGWTSRLRASRSTARSAAYLECVSYGSSPLTSLVARL